MRTADFDYVLPPELIAQHPLPERDQSRLLALVRSSGQIRHESFRDFPGHLRPGDVLVLNNSKVIPARLRAVNVVTGGRFEILLLEENQTNDWWAMMRPGKRAKRETQIRLLNHHEQPLDIEVQVQDENSEGHKRIRFNNTSDILNELSRIGEIPLPPYIERADPHASDADAERYQTVYAQTAGSVAAPTAGLHFTSALMKQIRDMGVTICQVTLHVGAGTFAPVKTDDLAGHIMHTERYVIDDIIAREIESARRERRRIIAVGTTSVRVLESAAAMNAGVVMAGTGRTQIFIHPPYTFQVVNALITNFHLPCSTLLMLVSAFAAPGETRGRDLILSAYAEAIRERYRFFSYGDAMLIE
ncbi:MAG: tRNA preQ1(34) S-adenosylmethionine ribosyltransferase-isomerase QueA [Opitutaceae bacterium]|nr:tRNA preQ1(34) S-adenosylmethionine ribosyltransferase-isomerase QueA [Verrucomicrobiales bacterium]